MQQYVITWRGRVLPVVLYDLLAGPDISNADRVPATVHERRIGARRTVVDEPAVARGGIYTRFVRRAKRIGQKTGQIFFCFVEPLHVTLQEVVADNGRPLVALQAIYHPSLPYILHSKNSVALLVRDEPYFVLNLHRPDLVYEILSPEEKEKLFLKTNIWPVLYSSVSQPVESDDRPCAPAR